MRSLGLLVVAVLAIGFAGCMDGKSGRAGTGPTEPEPTSDRISRGDRETDFEPRVATPEDIERLWGNVTEHLVMDQVVDYHTDPNAFSNVYDPVTQPLANPCEFADGIYFNNKQVTLDEGKTILPGSTNLTVGISWNEQDAKTTVEALAVGYRGNGEANYSVTPYVENGKSVSVEVEPKYWDLLGSTRTGWDFWVCVSDDRSTGSEDTGKFFLGSFRITMTVKRT